MPSYKAPLDDIRFVLNDVLDVEQLSTLPGYEDATPDTLLAVLQEGATVCEDVLAPLNQSGDAEGCHYENGDVRTPAGFKEAYEQFVSGGWPAMTGPAEYGGQGLPHLTRFVFDEMLCSANLSFSMYPELGHGAAIALERWGDAELKQRFLPKLIDGTWAGTMCLTEPHAGTDLGIIRTKAVPAGDGAYTCHRHEDLHLRRRARPDREHRAPRAREAARRARRHEGHLAVPRAQVPAHRGRRRSAPRTASPAAPSSTRWASRRTRRASSTSTARRAGWSASRTRACARCSR